MQRRDFLKASAALGAVASAPWVSALGRPRERLRVGMIGTGMRGQVLLSELLKQDGADVVALCDIERFMLDRALATLAEAGRPVPQVFTGGDDAWRGMLADARLDAVLIATPWELHAPQAIAAMEAKVAVGCEVVAGITLQDHWDVLRAQQRTGTPYMLLENVCYRRDAMAVLQMVRAGLFGELVHMQAGYQHDLRGVKFNSGNPDEPYGSGVEFGAKGFSEAQWRTQHSIDRNGELYPSHGIGPCAMVANIHRGNRFTHINAFASKARGLHDYILKHPKGGPDHPNAKLKFKLGDIVTPPCAARTARPSCCSTTPRCRARTRWASACRAPMACGWTSTRASMSKAAARRTSGKTRRSTTTNTTIRCGAHSRTRRRVPVTAAWTGSWCTPSSRR